MRYLGLFLLLVCAAGLWVTRPAKAVEDCPKVNLPYYCEILEKE